MNLSAAELAGLLGALALLVVAAQAFGQAFVALRQPRVIGEIVGGLLLGPTLFGAVAPHVQAAIFPSKGPVAAFLGGMYQMGLLLLMFCSGAELRAVFRRGDRRCVSLITVVGTVLPFLVGLLLVKVIDVGRLSGPAQSRTALVLVFALAVAVTSIPVISRIMFDLGILHTPFARIVLGVAVIEDTIVYIVLAVALGLAAPGGSAPYGLGALLGLHGGTASYFALHVVVTLAFFAAMLLAGPAVFRRSLRLRGNLVVRSNPLAYQLVVVLAATLACVFLGITALFGAFLAGIVASTAEGTEAAAVRGSIKDFAFAFFVPVYFALVGLQLDLLHHFDIAFFAIFLIVACIAKSVSVWLGARLSGTTSSGSTNLAIAMNARGGPGIVLASVTYSAGIINQNFFAILVMLAIVTSLLAGTWLGHLVRTGKELLPGAVELPEQREHNVAASPAPHP